MYPFAIFLIIFLSHLLFTFQRDFFVMSGYISIFKYSGKSGEIGEKR